MIAIPFAHEVGFSPILQAFDSQLTAHTHTNIQNQQQIWPDKYSTTGKTTVNKSRSKTVLEAMNAGYVCHSMYASSSSSKSMSIMGIPLSWMELIFKGYEWIYDSGININTLW